MERRNYSEEEDRATLDEPCSEESAPTIEILEAEWAALSCDCEWG